MHQNILTLVAQSTCRQHLIQCLTCFLVQHDGSHDHSDQPATPPLSPQEPEPMPAQLLSAQPDMPKGVQDSQAAIGGDQGLQADSLAQVAESDACMQSPSADKHEGESEQLDIPLHGPSNGTYQQQPDLTESADLHSIDRQSQSSDDSPPPPQDPQASTLQPNSTHLSSFGSLIETRPQSNGHADTKGMQEALTTATSIPGLTGPLTATAADDQSDSAHSEGNAADSMSQTEPEQQAEQQLPVPNLYMSSQMDQSSRGSLAESVQSVPASQQQPVSLESVFASQPQSEALESASASQHQSASPSSTDEADELGQAAPKQESGGVQGGEGSATGQEKSGSQQSSVDNDEQQAELPGTLDSTACVSPCMTVAGCYFDRLFGLSMRQQQDGQQVMPFIVPPACICLLSGCLLWLLRSTRHEPP